MLGCALKIHEVIRRGDGLLFLRFNGIQDIWVKGLLRGRVRECWKCGQTIQAKDMMFRPVGNHEHRMKRLCVACVDEIAPFKGGED